MSRARVVILGGGFGGLSAAHTLSRELGSDVELLLADRAPEFRMGLRKLWVLDARPAADEELDAAPAWPAQGSRSGTHRRTPSTQKGSGYGSTALRSTTTS